MYRLPKAHEVRVPLRLITCGVGSAPFKLAKKQTTLSRVNQAIFAYVIMRTRRSLLKCKIGIYFHGEILRVFTFSFSIHLKKRLVADLILVNIDVANQSCMLSDIKFCGPVPEVLQYRADPWQRWSKPLALRLNPKISLISLIPHGDRIRY